MTSSPANHPRDRIPNWGVDLDRANRPAVPMERCPPRLDGIHWDEPPRQQSDVEVLTSIEYPHRPPVFGTSVPPRGLSGWIRRHAFRRSENDLRHWLMLLVADRIEVVDGIFSDAGRSPRVRSAAAVVGVVLVIRYLLHRPPL